MLKYLSLIPCLALLACNDAEQITGTQITSVDLFNAQPERHEIGQLSYRGGLHIDHEDARFGGWSALEVNDTGTQILSVSDSAYWMTARLHWDAAGWISSVESIDIAPILGRQGEILEGEREDSETIAQLADGRYAVSFEREHRINAYNLGTDWAGVHDATGEAMPIPPGTDALPNNGGLEGLTPLSDGGLLAAIEYPLEEDGPQIFWHFDGTDWSQIELAPTNGYGITSLDVHDGQVYVLERFWNAVDGTRIRILRFAENELYQDALIQPDLLAAMEAENPVDNFEGISVIEQNDETILLIISDDNYNVYGDQRTLLLAFAVE